MSVLVRPYQPQDRIGFGHVRSMVYRNGAPVSPDENLIPIDCMGFVAEIDGRIVGAFTGIDMWSTHHHRLVRTMGIASVGVLQEARSQGVGKALMAESMRSLKESNFVLASLYPFRGSFYRKFGYEYCGLRRRITCPAADFPSVEPALPIRALKPHELDLVRPCYEAFAERYNGMNLRNEQQWVRQMGGETPFSLFTFGDPIEGYVAVRLQSTFWEDQPIREFVWTSSRAYATGLSFVKTLLVNKTSATWDEPGDGLFAARHFERGISVGIENPIMYRVIDVPSSLRGLRCEHGEGEFVLEVADTQLPENAGPWRVRFNSDGTTVEAVEASQTGIRLGIGAYTQAWMGEPGWEGVRFTDDLEVLAPAHLDAARKLMPFRRGLCLDYF